MHVVDCGKESDWLGLMACNKTSHVLAPARARGVRAFFRADTHLINTDGRVRQLTTRLGLGVVFCCPN